MKNVFGFVCLSFLGAASYVLTEDKSFSYTDIDFVFRCDLSSESVWTEIKDLVCQCLTRQILSTSKCFSPIIVQTAYFEKVVRVVNPKNGDSWALISLCNFHGENIELKFVDRMKRQFQFSVDSFQIILDPLLDFYQDVQQCAPTKKKSSNHSGSSNRQEKQSIDRFDFLHLFQNIVSTKLIGFSTIIQCRTSQSNVSTAVFNQL